MAKNSGPWGGSDDNQNPWQEIETPRSNPKIVDFKNIKKPENFEIKFSWVAIVVLLIWLASGLYQIEPNEQGVILRFGAYTKTTDAGLHYHLPYPIETVDKVSITQERSITLGETGAYSTSNVRSLSNGSNNKAAALESFTESHMLTGDENIVDVNLTVVWKIKDAKDYLFKMQDPDTTVRVAAQSVLREIVGQSEMQPIITGDRGKVEDDTMAELQKVMDDFNSGIQIVRVKLQKADPPKEVVDAFNEVQRAKADMERFKNEAEAYSNEILPKARGQASQIVQNSQAYKEAVVSKARGEADRFTYVLNAYKEGREVTTKRLYIETMEEVLSKSDNVIVDPSSKGGNVLPILPLDRNRSKQDKE